VGVDIEAFGPKHQLDALGDGRFVFDQQNPHSPTPLQLANPASANTARPQRSKRPLTI
jgi:hypothetical protein